MSLITRCPACTTLFKAVPDQLRIAGGWVRCGHCGEVFDAAAHMLPAEAVAPAPPGPDPDPPVAGAPEVTAPPVTVPPEPPPAPVAAPAPTVDSEPSPTFAAAAVKVPASVRLPAPVLPDAPDASEVAAPGPAAPAQSSAPPRFDAWRPTTPWVPPAAAPVAAPEVEAPSIPASRQDDGDADAPVLPPQPEPAASPEPALTDPAPAVAAPESDTQDLQPYALVVLQEGAPAIPASADADAAPVAQPESPAEDAPDEAPPPADVLLARHASAAEDLEREVPLSTEVDFVLSDVGELSPAPTPELDPAPEPAPLFVEQARRRAWWSSRPVRTGLWVAAAVLACALGMQWVLSQRDWLAAREPALAPALQSACRVLGCELAPYRQLEAIVIDSSAFNRVSPSAFRFSVTLRNTADMAVATPALELTLTDVQEQALVRRVLTAAELGAPPALAPRGEFSGSHGLTVASESNPSAIVGYRLMAFYP